TTWRRAISMRAYRARAWAHRSARCRRRRSHFLLIDGLNGGSTDAHHAGWFEIDSFDFDINDLIATCTGAGVGKVTFSPLTLQLSLNPALAGALRDAATGHDIGAIKLEGVTAQGQAVYDLTLVDASVTQLHEGNGGHDSLSFDYQKLGLITQVQQPNGSTAPGEIFGYDVAKNLLIDPDNLAVAQRARRQSAYGGAGFEHVSRHSNVQSRWLVCLCAGCQL